MTQNVVLITVDTARYDYFQRYATALDAATDVSFDECRTASTWSVPSHASMFTGRLPHEHGFHSATPEFSELDREDTFLGELYDYSFVGVSSNPYASPIFAFDSLFDEFYHVESSTPYSEGLSPSEFWHESATEGWTRYLDFLRACVLHENSAKSLANGVASQVEKLFQRLPVRKPFDDGAKRILSRVQTLLKQADSPTFVFANIMDVHGPLTNVRSYDQSLIAEEYRNHSPEIDALSMNMDGTFDENKRDIDAYRDLYAAAIEYTTRQIAKFVETVSEDTAVIVTSDHGEQLDDVTDKRRFGHVTPDMSEELLHVPLAVINADLSIDESEPVSHLDLGNLIASIATDTPFERQKPIAAEVAGLGVAHPPSDHEDFDYWNRVSRCTYLDGTTTKYVWDSLGKASHYEREDGKYALKSENGLGIIPVVAKDPFSIDVTDVEVGDPTSDVDTAVESQLEELGYL